MKAVILTLTAWPEDTASPRRQTDEQTALFPGPLFLFVKEVQASFPVRSPYDIYTKIKGINATQEKLEFFIVWG